MATRAVRKSRYGGDINIEDLITPQDMVVTISHGGYISQAQPLDDYRAQRRGGRGEARRQPPRTTISSKPCLPPTPRLSAVLSSLGRMYWIKVYDLPQGNPQQPRQADGQCACRWPMVKNQRPAAGQGVYRRRGGRQGRHRGRRSRGQGQRAVHLHVHRQRHGEKPRCKRSPARAAGIIAVKLDEGDNLIGVALTRATTR